MSLPPIPRLTPEAFRWHNSPHDASITQRLANGTEAWVGIKDENAKGQYDNFLVTTLRVVDMPGLTLASLREALAAALVDVRFQHPEVACTAVWGQDELPSRPHIQYASPASTAEALSWARGVVQTRPSFQGGGQALRADLERERFHAAVQEPAKSVSIYLVADVAHDASPMAPGSTLDLYAHFNHIFWDGISGRKFVGDLLRCLPRALAGETPEYSWGTEAANLSPPLLDATTVDVAALGSDFEATRDEFLAALFKTGSSYGLDITNKVGVPRTEWYNFSKAESERIVCAVKTRLGPQYTISHLAHAATVLALLKIKPLSASDRDSATLVMPLPVNGRCFLRDPLGGNQYGACQAGAAVDFDRLASWVVNEDDTDALRAVLERGARHVKDSYDYWLRKDYQLAVGVAKDNFLSAFLATSPMPYTGSSIPIFVTDGLVNRYVPGEVKADDGRTLLDVDNCVFLLNTYLSDLLIRMDSFKGATAMSFSFNDGYLSSEVAAAFLGYIADFMLKFAQ